ncbi:DNA mismatch repair endonuclease MutL [candidate division KSB1 bacterium]|nr:DNA mismatch repair endonuclease MutL [candidate division KSB1 bacterium]
MEKAIEPKIKVLSENLINKIAAGEVIDRPSSVIKELVENAIDAGADQITIVVRDGGRVLLQVVDNGCGMQEKDAIMSLQRHATSKVRTLRDIERITTLGFRGEALSSIASVSQMEIKTVPRDSIEGTQLNIEGGIIQKAGHTGGNPGTTISVRNIFYNTPARRKFLRSASTEYRHILSTLNRFTLCYPGIAFELINDDSQVFLLKPAELQPRIVDVLGSRIRDNLIPVHDDNALGTISGYVGNFDAMRKSRNDQYIFVNKRYINDRTIPAAVFAGYGESIPRGMFPLFVLFVHIDPERVDVNVHPTKSEVKFADQHMVYSLVRAAIKRALLSDRVIPEVGGSRGQSVENLAERFRKQAEFYSVQQTSFSFDTPPHQHEEKTLVPSGTTPEPIQNEVRPLKQQMEAPPVWQLHQKYILSHIKSGLVIVDQHAAHERILYEKAKQHFKTTAAASQQLLFPHTIELSGEDYNYLMDILPFLTKLGFMIKGFGGGTVVVEGVPSGLRIGEEDKALVNILDEYKKNPGSEVDVQERVAKSYACRSAIMTGQKLTLGEMNELLALLFASENPYFCPHGRPAMITISTDELDKRFERK